MEKLDDEIIVEIPLEDFLTIERILRKNCFMGCLGLRPSAQQTVFIHLSYSSSGQRDPESQTEMNHTKLLSIPSKIDMHHSFSSSEKRDPKSQTETNISKAQNILSKIEIGNENTSTPPSVMKLSPKPKETGLNGGYWSPTKAGKKKRVTSHQMVDKFESCARCKNKGQTLNMVICERCLQWTHVKCINLENDKTQYLDKYVCQLCQKKGRKNMAEKKKNKRIKNDWLCFCGQGEKWNYMIACDRCSRWFHGRCVNISKRKSKTLETYYCNSCKILKAKKLQQMNSGF